MTEQYMNQYKKETAQVHAPADLIERTKAAVRKEEQRILRERAVQEKSSAPAEVRVPQTMLSETAGHVDGTKGVKGFGVRKWAYPLTAAAALLILISVSLTMRGMKKSGSGMNGAAYEESAEADAGASEGTVLESTAEAGTTEEPAAECAPADFTKEAAEEEMAVESADEASMEAAAGGAENVEPTEDASAPVNVAQRSQEEMKQMTDATKEMEQTQDIEAAGASKGSLEKKEEAALKNLADSVASADTITIEEVESKPAFCSLPDTETHVCQGTTFLVREEKNGWTAYVEAEDGTGYVLFGEAENLEAFLEAGYERLSQSITLE